MKKLKWKVQESKSGKSNYNIVGESLGGKYKIARVPFMVDCITDKTAMILRQEAFQHATLISAAPELLEALQNIVDALSKGQYIEGDIYVNAKKAINKALTTQP